MKQQKKKATMANKLENVINTIKTYLCLSLLIMKEVFKKQIFLILGCRSHYEVDSFVTDVLEVTVWCLRHSH